MPKWVNKMMPNMSLPLVKWCMSIRLNGPSGSSMCLSSIHWLYSSTRCKVSACFFSSDFNLAGYTSVMLSKCMRMSAPYTPQLYSMDLFHPDKSGIPVCFTCLLTRLSDCCFRSDMAAWYPSGFPICSMCHKPVLTMIISGCWSPPALHQQCMGYTAPWGGEGLAHCSSCHSQYFRIIQVRMKHVTHAIPQQWCCRFIWPVLRLAWV